MLCVPGAAHWRPLRPVRYYCASTTLTLRRRVAYDRRQPIAPSFARNWVRRTACSLQSLPRRPLGAGEVRVALKAAGVNFPDVLMIQGLYQHRPELPFVPGLEAAGVVSEVARRMSAGIAVGQKVIAQMRTGGYAEEAVVPAGAIRPMPRRLLVRGRLRRSWWRT